MYEFVKIKMHLTDHLNIDTVASCNDKPMPQSSRPSSSKARLRAMII